MKRFFREHGFPLLIIGLFVAMGGIGIYNSAKFRAKCEALGGVPLGDHACVKPGSTIEVPR
jgi:hypothetical protein